MQRATLLASAAALALGLVGMQSQANAAVMQVFSSAPLSATPFTVSFGGASFSFTIDNSASFPMSSVMTSGTGLVTTIFGGVADFGAGSQIDGNQLYTFTAYPAATSIPNSSAVDFIGFSYQGTGGTHYGFAEVFGNTFLGYAYETAANTTIVTQDIQSTTQAVPEPASAALLMGGLTMVGLARRNRRTDRRELAA